ncbi:CapA family protein [Actinomyces ruminicola]|uniref:CapA family protein n=1 Tax=Actinomyces ruminicola TaxID=332524 RepID=UPI0021C320E2|nr:CapA family protein [Actinomyces ruminicola]
MSRRRVYSTKSRGARPRLTGAALVVGTVITGMVYVLAVGLPWPLGPLHPGASSPTPSRTSAPRTPSASATPSPARPPDIRLTIGYAGDVLTHMPVIEDTADGQGDITPLIAAATPWSAGVDLALCGMEVPVSPTGVASGYPVFATLPTVVSALSDSGWDGCATASNHAWDQGFEGVLTTADALRANGMGYAGTNRTEAEAASGYQLYEIVRNGVTVTVAEISTTYGLNGFTAEPAWAVDLNDVDAVAARARQARRRGAALVVLHTQIGEEYLPQPVTAQTEYARAVAATGEVDLLFGAHPHVPQTNELLPGGPGGRGMWVSYSAGNFLSNQSEAQGTVLAGVGLFVWADVVVSTGTDGAQEARVEALNWHPFTVDNLGGHRLVDLAAAQRGEIEAGCTLSAAEIDRRWRAVMDTVNNETYSDTIPVPTGQPPVALPRS